MVGFGSIMFDQGLQNKVTITSSITSMKNKIIIIRYNYILYIDCMLAISTKIGYIEVVREKKVTNF